MAARRLREHHDRRLHRGRGDARRPRRATQRPRRDGADPWPRTRARRLGCHRHRAVSRSCRSGSRSSTRPSRSGEHPGRSSSACSARFSLVPVLGGARRLAGHEARLRPRRPASSSAGGSGPRSADPGRSPGAPRCSGASSASGSWSGSRSSSPAAVVVGAVHPPPRSRRRRCIFVNGGESRTPSSSSRRSWTSSVAAGMAALGAVDHGIDGGAALRRHPDATRGSRSRTGSLRGDAGGSAHRRPVPSEGRLRVPSRNRGLPPRRPGRSRRTGGTPLAARGALEAEVQPSGRDARRWLRDWLRSIQEWFESLFDGVELAPGQSGLAGRLAGHRGRRHRRRVPDLRRSAPQPAQSRARRAVRRRRRARLRDPARARPRAAEAGDFATAIAEMFRALARGLSERTIVMTSPGTTAHGFARRGRDGVPGCRGASRDARPTTSTACATSARRAPPSSGSRSPPSRRSCASRPSAVRGRRPTSPSAVTLVTSRRSAVPHPGSPSASAPSSWRRVVALLIPTDEERPPAALGLERGAGWRDGGRRGPAPAGRRRDRDHHARRDRARDVLTARPRRSCSSTPIVILNDEPARSPAVGGRARRRRRADRQRPRGPRPGSRSKRADSTAATTRTAIVDAVQKAETVEAPATAYRLGRGEQGTACLTVAGDLSALVEVRHERHDGHGARRRLGPAQRPGDDRRERGARPQPARRHRDPRSGTSRRGRPVRGHRPDASTELQAPWTLPLTVLLLLVALAAAVWRWRRFGPLVIENLPVVVRAGETMEGRARLYERGSARLHALDALRIGTVTRLARLCSLPRTASVEEVVDAVAALTGRNRAEVAALLVDDEPASRRGPHPAVGRAAASRGRSPADHKPGPTERRDPCQTPNSARPSPASAPKSARPSSDRMAPSPASSSPCSPAATCCSRGCRASPRPCSCAASAAR